jgi:hypothetical protein
MTGRGATWTAFFSAFIASALALRVALSLDSPYGPANPVQAPILAAQSRCAAVAALAALVSAVAQIIARASG